MTFARVRALIFVAVLFVTAGIVVIMAIGRDSQTKASQALTCAAGEVPAHNDDAGTQRQVTINVFNGTSPGRPGRGHRRPVQEPRLQGRQDGDRAPAADGKPYDNSPPSPTARDAVGAAYLVSAYFLVNDATMQFDIKRKGAEVDVILGTQFQQLATTTEVNQSIAVIGKPPLEQGTCEA